MGTGYTRNDTGNNIADGNVINASDLDGEFDAVEAAFNNSTGHTHDGTSAEGAPIEVAGPAQDLVITATEVRPKTDNTLDLGTTTLEFKDAFFDGTVKTDTLTVDENATVTGNLTVNGNTTLGNAATDTVTVTADVASDLIPSADGTYDLGASGSEWQDLYIDGTANIDSLVADTADINAGSIDGVTLGTNSAVTSAVITTADINGGTIDDTTIGGSTPAAGSFTTITGSGDMNIDSGTLFVDASENRVGIGTSSPSTPLQVNGTAYVADDHIQLLLDSGNGRLKITDSSNDTNVDIFGSNGQAYFAGNVGIGTSSPSNPLHVDGSALVEGNFTASKGNLTTTLDGETGNSLLRITGDVTLRIDFGTSADKDAGRIGYDTAGDNMQFSTDNSERMRIDSSGRLFVGTTQTRPSNANVTGLCMDTTSGGFSLSLTGDNQTPIEANLKGTDGNVININQDGTTEGSIAVNGTTVSLIGGNLSRWSRLADDSKDTSIVKGTVMTNLDAMVEWGDEDNEQLNKMAVSSVEGDSNVAGVFVNWDEGDDWNDMNIAMTGDMVIRIAEGTTVQRGDLLMSAGDGTAKPQGDDIVRSKTIAKVTSTHVSHTYDDGSYLVPCVLMAC